MARRCRAHRRCPRGCRCGSARCPARCRSSPAPLPVRDKAAGGISARRIRRYNRFVPAGDLPDPGFATSVAPRARVYDYWLGGTDNFPADREAAERVLAATPGLRFRVRANRAFLARAVRYLAGEAGIGQFLDIGTGIPSADNTHQVAQAVAPDARVVYA